MAKSALGRDVFLDANVLLEGKVTLGDRVRVGPNVVLRDVAIGADSVIHPNSVLEQSELGTGCIIGPYARVRPGSKLGANVHIGNFVELKKTEIADGSKANHLTYLGDAVIGKGVNVGAGTITCNYDGVNKSTTTIEDGAFIGSGNMLVAPVRIGKDATTGAGSTITKDAPDGQLTLTRGEADDSRRLEAAGEEAEVGALCGRMPLANVALHEVSERVRIAVPTFAVVLECGSRCCVHRFASVGAAGVHRPRRVACEAARELSGVRCIQAGWSITRRRISVPCTTAKSTMYPSGTRNFRHCVLRRGARSPLGRPTRAARPIRLSWHNDAHAFHHLCRARGISARARAALRGVPAGVRPLGAVVLERRTERAFTAIEQICHVRDIEIEGYQVRFRRTLDENSPLLPSIDSEAVAKERGYGTADATKVFAEFRAGAREDLAPAARPGRCPLRAAGACFEGYGPVTLRGLVHYLCSHDQQHLSGLQWLLGKIDAVSRRT